MHTNVQIKQALDDKMMKTTHSSPFDFSPAFHPYLSKLKLSFMHPCVSIFNYFLFLIN